MKIPRIYDELSAHLKPNKVLIIFGPRQVGKTTLLNYFLKKTKLKYKLVSGDNIHIQNLFGTNDFDEILSFVKGYDLFAIDEAQKVKNIGNGLKILVDHCRGIKIIATGSSSFELAGQIGEPLTGRKHTLTLFPVSQIELGKLHNPFELKQKIDEWLIFGGYPEVVMSTDKKDKIQLLTEIVHSYLLKDILELERVKSSKVLLDLLRMLAFQIGKEVSLNELSRNLGIDIKTVARYLDLFEKSFVIYNLRGFSRNLRSEITKKSKYFFYDNGIRNAVIASFNPLNLRNDIGALWENFLIAERLKKQSYTDMYANNYFWRTWSQQEIDFIEEREGKLFGYEFKWSKKTILTPSLWRENYPDAEFHVINLDKYLPFVT